jgi:hypothetical protein
MGLNKSKVDAGMMVVEDEIELISIREVHMAKANMRFK